MGKIQVCECCGANIIKYKRKLSSGILHGLFLLDRLGGVSEFKLIQFKTFNNRTNFQQLRYWSFIEHVDGKGSAWAITEKGLNFLKGIELAPKHVMTFRNEVIGQSDEMVSIDHVLGDHAYWHREDYLKNRIQWESQ
jgi:hypothetical protein